MGGAGVYGFRYQKGIKSSRASQELDMIEDMAESIGMLSNLGIGRRSK